MLSSTLSVTGLFSNLALRTPSQSRLSAVTALPKGEPRGGLRPPSAEGETCDPGGAAALGSPYGGAGERSASLRGRLQWQIGEKCGDSRRVPSQSWHQCANLQLPAPSQSRLTPCQLSHRESQGAGVARPTQRNICGANFAASPPFVDSSPFPKESLRIDTIC